MSPETTTTSNAETCCDGIASALAWAETFARNVRDRDFTAGQSLFSEHVHSFGTRAVEAEGLDQLLSKQWHPTWSRTEGFAYLPGSLRARISKDGSMATLTARWKSYGVDDPCLWGQQEPYPRAGRCTFVLHKLSDGSWSCVHSHFSANPDPDRPI